MLNYTRSIHHKSVILYKKYNIKVLYCAKSTLQKCCIGQKVQYVKEFLCKNVGLNLIL